MGANMFVGVGTVAFEPRISKTDKGALKANIMLRMVHGVRYQRTTTISCIFWRDAAEFIEEYVEEGTEVIVQGSVLASSYEDDNGDTKWYVFIGGESISLVGEEIETPRREEKRSKPKATQQKATQYNKRKTKKRKPVDDFEDEVDEDDEPLD